MNTRFISLVGIALFVVDLAVLEAFARVYFLYWKFWWLDIVMHAAGGFAVGALTIWLALFVFAVPERFARFVLPLVFALAIGIFWELAEYVVGTPREIRHTVDTISDVGMDAAGALVASLIARRRT